MSESQTPPGTSSTSTKPDEQQPGKEASAQRADDPQLASESVQPGATPVAGNNVFQIPAPRYESTFISHLITSEITPVVPNGFTKQFSFCLLALRWLLHLLRTIPVQFACCRR